MAESGFPLLSVILWVPLAGAALVLLTRGRSAAAAVAMLAALVSLLAAVAMVVEFDPQVEGYQFLEERDWIPALDISYRLGIDGISVLMVLLTAILTPIVVATSWLSINRRVKEYMAAMLLLETGLLGVFMALDLVLFYVFWELVLIPMYLLIGVWGGPNRIYATIKFFLFTFVGSVLMLLAILVIAFDAGSFNVILLPEIGVSSHLQTAVFGAFFLAFAIKAPMFPFHTWLPDAHVEAPTGGSVILAGVLLKMGGYGFLRYVLPLTPEAVDEFRVAVMALSVVAIIYGALVAMMQRDLKKLVAYSSVSHMGFVTLGIFSQEQIGIDGAIVQMFSHGLVTGALFLCVGIVYDRTHTRLFADLGGFAKRMPVYALLLGFFTLASLGLPMMSGFVGEFMVLLAAFGWSYAAGVLALLGVVLAAAYMLWMYKRVVFGELRSAAFARIPDANRVEVMALLPLVVLVMWVGISPGTFVGLLDTATAALATYR
jgi:NADH-quinone oxidoreductase subunit M